MMAYNSSYGGGTQTPSSSRSLTDPYHLSYLAAAAAASSDIDLPKYSSSSLYHLAHSDILRYSSHQPWPPGVDTSDPLPLTPAIKRPSDALYHPTVLGTHATIGQTEAWYSANSLAKRPRFESASNLPVYPQRPGEKDCAHYMQTRTCKYGDTCKFDHPIWVPEGGIPDWKEVPLVTASDSLPERPGELDCPFFLKTQRCKFGLKCKFNHPKEQLIAVGGSGNADVSALPERPSEPPCAFYLKTGTCKFGATCKFDHPKDIHIPLAEQVDGNGKQSESVIRHDGTAGDVNLLGRLVSYAPTVLYNSKGLPMRAGEVDCPFYLKTGSCKYGASCRYNHPDRHSINPPAAAMGHPLITSPAASLSIGVVNPAASMYQTIDPRLAQSTLGVGSTFYPQRPGQTECDYYMKTGECKYGERCRFHHPIDRSAPLLSAAKLALQEAVKLTLAGLPRREGSVHCPYYMKTGTCKYGATCKFDHPPPGEVMAMAASTGIGEDEREAETDHSQ